MKQQTRLWKPNPQAMATFKRTDDTDTWLTPRWILDELGPFEMDPCASPLAPRWVAPDCFTESDDGLAQEWRGRVFCNPPYSNTAAWIDKHADYGYGVMLVPASVESVVWRRRVWPEAHAIYLLHGRTRFCAIDGSTTTGRPLRSVCLIAWDQYEAKLLEAAPFAGVLLKSWNQR